MNSAISIKNLQFNYGAHTIFKDVSLEIKKNVLTVFLGSNGSGKSTLLRIIAGLIPCEQGRIQVNGVEIQRLSGPVRSHCIGFLGQQHRPVFPFTVYDVVLTGRVAHARFAPGSKDRRAAEEAIAEVGITELTNRPYTELSGGEQQLVMIARTLAQEPLIILLDEPTSHLDFNNQVAVLSLLKKLVNKGITIVAVLHDPNMAFLYGDDFVFVHRGAVVREERNDVWNSPIINKIYGERIERLQCGGRAVIVPALEEP